MAVRVGWVVAVARASAAWWQLVACNPETIPADRAIALLCCAPLHLLARLAAFLCVPFIPAHLSLRLPTPRRHHHLFLPPPELVLPPYSPSLYSSSSSSSSSSDDDDDDMDDGNRARPHID